MFQNSFLPAQGAGVRASVRFPLAAATSAVLALCALTAQAQQQGAAARLSDTVVTATRTETRLDETLADVR
ncbi:MAG: hypothetical protein RR855_22130, partial [Comamonas sp.]